MSSRYQNGFIADTFVRPPINIKIYFKEKIKIDKIILNSKVNSQVSNGFIISSSIDTIHPTVDEKINFRQICKNINENNKTCFNYEFHRRSQTTTETSDANVNLQCFTTSYISYLNFVSAVNISIIRTQNGSCPCLRSIKILGSLSYRTENFEIVPKTKEIVELKNRDDEIPIEFLDELTHELMRLPILLPSGHKIDKTSLDRYLNEQKQANDDFYNGVDPFTRVAFSAHYKPIVEDRLKGKIDQFLLDGSTSKKRKLDDIIDDHDGIRGGDRVTIEKQFVNKQFKKDIDLQLISCVCCLNRNNLNLYEICLCKHIYCRHCVLKLKDLCFICKKQFKTSDVVSLKCSNDKIN